MVGAGITALTFAAFTFKLAFTDEDAPELVVGFAKTIVDVMAGPSLVTRARVVFLGLAIAAACVSYFIFTRTQLSPRVSGMFPRLLILSCYL
jgi:ethanolaminephosphotransferase